MPLMTWNKDLELEVNDMNAQHQKLLSLMNKLFDLNDTKADKPTIVSALHDLGNYTVEHFEQEEAYMESVGFPKLEVHKKIHKDLLSKFGEHQSEFIQSKESVLNEQFFSFLKLWLRAHIMGIDKQYSDHASKSAA